LVKENSLKKIKTGNFGSLANSAHSKKLTHEDEKNKVILEEIEDEQPSDNE